MSLFCIAKVFDLLIKPFCAISSNASDPELSPLKEWDQFTLTTANGKSFIISLVEDGFGVLFNDTMSEDFLILSSRASYNGNKWALSWYRAYSRNTFMFYRKFILARKICGFM